MRESLALYSACILCMGFSATAWAQATPTESDAPQVAEVVVTAQKRVENVQNVPIAITALSAQDADKFGVSSTADLKLAVPGLNIDVANGIVEARLRGVGLNSVAPGDENSVATYVDGVYIASTTAALLTLNNISSIEVDKGPQGTLFGRNATGGVISVTTKNPTQDFHGSASFGYGNYNNIITNDYITGGILPNLAADLSVRFADRLNGYGVNLATGNSIGQERDTDVRSKWLWTPTPNDKITLILDFSDVKSSLYNTDHELPGTTTQFGGTNPALLFGGPYAFAGGFHDTATPVDPTFREQQGGVSLALRHDFSVLQAVSITAYRVEQNEVMWSPNPAPTAVEFGSYKRPGYQFSQELQFLSPNDSPIKWALGAYYFESKASWDPFNVSGPLFNELVFGTPANPVPSFLHLAAGERTQSEAGFAQATAPIRFLGDTNLTAGLRYTPETRKAFGEELGEIGTPPQGIPVAVIGSFDAPGAVNKTTADKLTYRIAIDHRFSKNLLVYASDNLGFKSGGFNTSTPGSAPFLPETLSAYEAGFKSDWLERRLRVNASAFYYDYSNIQVTKFTPLAIIELNGAKARIYGLDLDAQAQLTRRLNVTFGMEVLHDRFQDFPSAPFLTPDTVNGGIAGFAADGAGKQLPNVPELTANASGSYEIPTTVGPLALSLSYYHNSGWYIGVANDPTLRQRPFDVFNFDATWTSTDKRYRVRAFAENFTNEEYGEGYSEAANPGGWARVLAAPPRTYGAEVQVSF